jgi:hypothetical protein
VHDDRSQARNAEPRPLREALPMSAVTTKRAGMTWAKQPCSLLRGDRGKKAAWLTACK